MPLHRVTGDPLRTQAQTLAFTFNQRGRLQNDPLSAALHRRYPPAFSMAERQCRQNKLHGGDLWLWRESRPRLLFLLLRDAPVGATRLRYVQAAALSIARDYRLLQLNSLALAPLGIPSEQDEILRVLETHLHRLPIPVMLYTDYAPGLDAESGLWDADA